MNDREFFARLAAQPASKPALIGDGITLDYGTLLREVARFATLVRENRVRVLATLLDNGPAWVIADLAALRAGIVHVPIPAFFTPEQAAYVIAAAGIDAMLSVTPQPRWRVNGCNVVGAQLSLCTRNSPAVAVIDGSAKVTFTSGTTGTPKGVCLSAASMLAVADGVARATSMLRIERHLCALPLPVLLENVAGVYAPLLAGAASVVPPLAALGVEGSSRFNPSRLDLAAREYAADSVIVLPQMLRAWSAWRSASTSRSALSLRFIAVGGAAVGAGALAEAHDVGLPAFEGYGLSEGASVQTLNLPDANRPGSVGRALPHARVRIASDGEIEIAGSAMLGYLGELPSVHAWWPTGDLGSIDAEGYVYVHGRKKHVLITAFGRNVSPEWVETALAAQSPIAHAVVQGDGKPALEAVLWPLPEDACDGELASAVLRANAALPDYARVARFVRARVPYTTTAGVCTANGRPLRRVIETMHADAFNSDSRVSDVLL